MLKFMATQWWVLVIGPEKGSPLMLYTVSNDVYDIDKYDSRYIQIYTVEKHKYTKMMNRLTEQDG